MASDNVFYHQVMRDVFWMICLLTPVATSISVYSGYSITLTCNITNTDNAILTWEHQDVNNQHSVIAVGTFYAIAHDFVD